MTTTKQPPPITPLEFSDADYDKAEALAKALGYEQTAYTSTSALWGLFCLPENPRTWRGPATALRGGCIIKTAQFGLLFVQDTEDITGEVEREEMPLETEKKWRECSVRGCHSYACEGNDVCLEHGAQ